MNFFIKVLFGFLFAPWISAQVCRAPAGSPNVNFCPNLLINSNTFIADPEVRTYQGQQYMVFTALIVPGVTPPHLYMARYFPALACWGDVHQVTFGETNTPIAEYNECSSFWIENRNFVYVYMWHYTKPTPTSEHDIETFSHRVKIGLLNPTTGAIIGFGSSEILSPAAGANTFVLWASGSQSPDQGLALSQPPPNCIGPFEISVFHDDSTNASSRFHYTVGCYNVQSETFSVRMYSADNWYLFNPSAGRELLSASDFCGADVHDKGWLASTIIRYQGQFYLSASPMVGLGYDGCVFYRFLGNSLDNDLDLNDPVGQIHLGLHHSGSCSGGAGSLNSLDVELNNKILHFYQPWSKGAFRLRSATFPTPSSWSS